jgi:hypothetical protein
MIINHPSSILRMLEWTAAAGFHYNLRQSSESASIRSSQHWVTCGSW